MNSIDDAAAMGLAISFAREGSRKHEHYVYADDLAALDDPIAIGEENIIKITVEYAPADDVNE